MRKNSGFTEVLLSWYRLNRRDLPWRRTKDPYKVWLSEIILQQTRIAQGLPYYERFVSTFPTVGDLAAADEQSVLKLWQGLGYYTRARNLHAAAKQIMLEQGGRFPSSYEEILALKGVGEYTASAVASICFGLPHALVDGNVIRFVSRYFGVEESAATAPGLRRIARLAEEHLDTMNPGDYNQAMMEFGATVCTPAAPGCSHCPFRNQCKALIMDKVESLPVAKPKTAVRHRYLHYLVLTSGRGANTFIYIRQRTGKDIWKNLYDFPCVETPSLDATGLLAALGLRDPEIKQLELQDISEEYVHVLSHQVLHVRFYRFHGQGVNLPLLRVLLGKINAWPFPRLIERYLADFSKGRTGRSFTDSGN